MSGGGGEQVLAVHSAGRRGDAGAGRKRRGAAAGAALAEGTALKVEVEAIRAGSLGSTKPVIVDQYFFDEVQLTGLKIGQRAGDSDHVLSFDFGELQHAVLPSSGSKTSGSAMSSVGISTTAN